VISKLERSLLPTRRLWSVFLVMCPYLVSFQYSALNFSSLCFALSGSVFVADACLLVLGH